MTYMPNILCLTTPPGGLALCILSVVYTGDQLEMDVYSFATNHDKTEKRETDLRRNFFFLQT